jgi:hypothetical protein
LTVPRFVLRFAAGIFCSVLLISSALIFASRAANPGSVMPELKVCHGQICIWNISLQDAHVEDAQLILKSEPQLVIADYSQLSAYKQTSPYYRIDLFPSEYSRYVNEIGLLFHYNSITAGDFIVAYGDPCAIVINYIPGTKVLKYPGMVVFFQVDQQAEPRRFEFFSPLREINIFNNLASCADINFDSNNLPWRGFTTY